MTSIPMSVASSVLAMAEKINQKLRMFLYAIEIVADTMNKPIFHSHFSTFKMIPGIALVTLNHFIKRVWPLTGTVY